MQGQVASDGPRPRRSATDSSGDGHILGTRPAPMRPVPMARAARSASPAGTPSAAVSGTAAATARSAREHRPMRPSGEWLPARDLGIPRLMAPTPVAGLRTRQPLRRLPPPRAPSARAPMASLTGDSAIALMGPATFTMPSSNPGIGAPAPAISRTLPICGYRPSTDPDFGD